MLSIPFLLFAGSTLLCAESAGAVNFSSCLADVQNGMYGPNPGAVDQYGDPVANVSDAIGITYNLCITACGAGVEPFAWSLFSQSFSAWMLPWLALISQLPFGAKHRSDNFMSVLLAVGSPTLAGYSLMLTVLNNRYVGRRFSSIKYPNAKQALGIMRNLQQAPLEINGTLLPSLVVLADNDHWWQDLFDRLNYVHSWSISAAASIAWVVVAYIFTVVDSFTALSNDFGPVFSPDINDGQAIGSVWLWLLAVVIGWLQLSPKCDDATVKAAMDKANKEAFIASDDGVPLKASEMSDEWAFFLVEEGEGDNEDGARDDERASPPIYNYARFFPWSQNVERVVSVFRNAASRAHMHIPANLSSSWHKAERDDTINGLNRNGTLDQLHSYCADPASPRRGSCDAQICSRFLLAACAGLALQWGTVGGALINMIYTPTKGLGCRSATYLFYALLSTLIWFLLVLSSFLLQASSARLKRGTRVAMRKISIYLRRIGKFLALCNTVFIIAGCISQFSNVYNTCYCNVQLLAMLKHAFASGYDVIVMSPSMIAGLQAPWGGGVALGCICVFLYVLLVNLFRG